MRTTILILFITFFYQGLCQKKVDGEFIFKTQLFLEKANVTNTKAFETKDKGLLLFFDRNVKLKLDTLQSYGFSDDYVFLSLPMKNGIMYNDTIIKSDSSFFLFIADNCSDYVLAVSKSNGKSFRLKGFSGNDFFTLFIEINKRFERLNHRTITVKKFLKDYSVSSVDFLCLYSAVKSGEYNKAKYPCIKGCEVENIIIH
jgi:hypothetical protein